MLLGSAFSEIFQLLTVFFIFIAVLILTYYSTKWIAGYQKAGQIRKNLEVVEAVRVSGNTIVEILRVGHNKYIVIGITKDRIEKLGEISKEDLETIQIDSRNVALTNIKFKDTLKDIIEKLKKGKK